MPFVSFLLFIARGEVIAVVGVWFSFVRQLHTHQMKHEVEWTEIQSVQSNALRPDRALEAMCSILTSTEASEPCAHSRFECLQINSIFVLFS